MNGEEDERERTRTRRVETEHDRDEHGVGVAGSGRLQPRGGLPAVCTVDCKEGNSSCNVLSSKIKP